MRDFFKYIFTFSILTFFIVDKKGGYGFALFHFQMNKNFPRYSQFHTWSLLSIKYQSGFLKEKYLQFNFCNNFIRIYFERNNLHNEHLGI